MRVKRSKQYRKLMHSFQLSFGFRPPYQVLLDAQIIRDASKYKINLGLRLEDTLQCRDLKPMITQCCIRHLYNHPTKTDAEKREKDAWIEVAKSSERRRCGHHELEEPLSTLDCLESVVDPKGSGTNKHRYVVASQDEAVRRHMRSIAGVPLVYINRSVMILEPMAQASEDVKEREERGKKVKAGLRGARDAASTRAKRSREDDAEDDTKSSALEGALDGAPESKKRRVRGPKWPNPLSVKKPKKEDKKSAPKQVEDERSVLRKAAKHDPQAAEKALDATTALNTTPVDGVTEGARKRKRKRKAKVSAGDTADAGGGSVAAVK